jgi:hypothetical protein
VDTIAVAYSWHGSIKHNQNVNTINRWLLFVCHMDRVRRQFGKREVLAKLVGMLDESIEPVRRQKV